METRAETSAQIHAQSPRSVAPRPILRLLFLRLALQNLARRPGRTCVLALGVAIASAALLVAATLLRGIDAGMNAGLSRMGADLLVVPSDTLVHLSGALLTVEPTPHLLDAEVMGEIARMPGVRRVAGQRIFPTPAGSTSCNHEVDLIAFDPERDFTVQPWLGEKLERPRRSGDILVGGRRDYRPGDVVNFYGRGLTVYGRLVRTGVGPFDHAFFVDFDTVAALARASEQQSAGSRLQYDPGKLSALLVQLEVGASAEEVRFAVAQLAGVKVISAGSLVTSVRQGLSALFGGVLALAALMLLGTVFLVGALFSAILAERRRELGLLLAIGARRRQLLRLILFESVLTTGLGGLAGTILGGLVLLFYRRSLIYYFESIQVPFTWPGVGAWLGLAASSVLLAALVGLLGTLLPAWRIGLREPFALIRGEE